MTTSAVRMRGAYPKLTLPSSSRPRKPHVNLDGEPAHDDQAGSGEKDDENPQSDRTDRRNGDYRGGGASPDHVASSARHRHRSRRACSREGPAGHIGTGPYGDASVRDDVPPKADSVEGR